MILAGWLLAILGLAQVVYSGTLDVTQVIEGNRLLGLAPTIVANPNLLAQRNMIHEAGCATFLAGAVFLAAAYLKPPPEGARARAWTNMGAIAALSLAVGAAAGFGLFLYEMGTHNAAQQMIDAERVKEARAQASARLLDEGGKQLQAPGGPPTSTLPPGADGAAAD